MRADARFLGAGITTAIVDGLFACALALVYGSTITRLWEGVAMVATKQPSAPIGVAVHVGVAFFWSAVFLLLSRWRPIRERLGSWRGVVLIACLYGPLIWIVMSLGVIPLMTQRPPNVTYRWWIQLAGHAIFVAMPIVSWFRERR